MKHNECYNIQKQVQTHQELKKKMREDVLEHPKITQEENRVLIQMC